MLTIQILQPGDKAAFVAYSTSGRHGMLSCVYPGGRYLGFSFDDLVALGSGQHNVIAPNEREQGPTGERQEYLSKFDEELARFTFVLFAYGCGAFTAREVLAIAEDVLAARSK